MSSENSRPTDGDLRRSDGRGRDEARRATPERLLAWGELAQIVPFSRQHVARLERRGLFPARLQLGPGRVAWKVSEIERWIENRARGALDVRIERTK